MGNNKISIKQDLLIIGDTRYYLDKVLKIGGSGPVVKLKADDINTEDIPGHEVSKALVKIRADSTVIFYKQNGKYTPICGKDFVVEKLKSGTLVSGFLISSVALKKCKVTEEQQMS